MFGYFPLTLEGHKLSYHVGEWQTQLSRPQLRARRQKQQKDKHGVVISSSGNKLPDETGTTDQYKTGEEVISHDSYRFLYVSTIHIIMLAGWARKVFSLVGNVCLSLYMWGYISDMTY